MLNHIGLSDSISKRQGHSTSAYINKNGENTYKQINRTPESCRTQEKNPNGVDSKKQSN